MMAEHTAASSAYAAVDSGMATVTTEAAAEVVETNQEQTDSQPEDKTDSQ